MQRSFSSSAADHQNHSRSSTYRHFPVRLIYNNGNDYYSSDTNLHNKTYLNRASSNSSISSASSVGNANYRILPVRYSSVDRVLSKPPQVTRNQHGINVHIEFDRPTRRRRRRHHYHHHHHQQQQQQDYQEDNQSEQREEYFQRRYTNRQEEQYQQQYGSCPSLNQMNRQHPSNITYIETRSIVRDDSNDRFKSTSKSHAPINLKIRHIPMDHRCVSTPVISRVIREEE